MDPTQLIPTPDILPAPWGFFYPLLILTFSLHLILANILLGAGFLVLWRGIRNRTNAIPDPLSREISRKWPMTIAFTVNLGVAPLLFLQILYGQFIYVSSVLMAVYWLAIFVLIIFAYYGAYLYQIHYDRLGGARIWIAGISVLILIVVGFFFTNSLLLMIDPKVWPRYFQEPGGSLIHWTEPSLIPRYLHFLFASIAAGGLIMALMGRRQKEKGHAGAEDHIRQGLVLYGCVTLFQFLIGAWYLGGLPGRVLSQVFFDSSWAFPAFIISVMAGGVSVLFAFAKMPLHTTACAVLTTLLMILFRFQVRSAYMAPYAEQTRVEVITQYGPALVFVLALVMGIAVIIYMLRLALRANRETRL